MGIKKFWIIDSKKPKEYVDFEEIAKHEDMCQKHHYQSAQRLNERGGLTYGEIVDVITGMKSSYGVSKEKSREELLEFIKIYQD